MRKHPTDILNKSQRSDATRRGFLLGSAAAWVTVLTGCATTSQEALEDEPVASEAVRRMYAAMPDEEFPIPAVDLSQVGPRYYRQLVDDPTGEKPGTLVVVPRSFFLYLVRPGGKAMRYGVGVGRAGFEWSGPGMIQWKQKWPKWTPPSEMIAREPELEKYSAENGGMEPGLNNPLGARALYIFEDGKDTLYRLHGTPEAWSIGKAVSSGCIRLLNQDIVDLYNRVPTRTPIVVV